MLTDFDPARNTMIGSHRKTVHAYGNAVRISPKWSVNIKSFAQKSSHLHKKHTIGFPRIRHKIV